MSELHNKILIKKDIQEKILKALFAVLIFCCVPGFYLTLKYIEGKFSEKLNGNRGFDRCHKGIFCKGTLF